MKEKILHHYKQLVQDKIDVFRDMISGLTEDSKNDAKGSAGDKHETALSMMHLEQEKLNRKIAEYLEQKNVLDKIDISRNSGKVAVGNLVTANKILLFVSAALPKISIEGKTVLALSPESPLGQKLMGKEEGHQFEINGTQYIIHKIE